MHTGLQSLKMNDKTRLQLLRAVYRKYPIGTGSSGFTLVELMIVVAIVGILSAVAIPNFIRARDAAAVGAAMGEAVSLAKECATSAASDISVGTTAAGNKAITLTAAAGGCTDGGSVTVNAASFNPSLSTNVFPAGIRCLDQKSAGTNTKGSITVSADGSIACAFS
jgi:type IV pilus assembly protein PilA